MIALLLAPQTILIAAAVIPALFLLAKVYKEDKLEKEPPRLILSLLLWGILSTFSALILEEIGTFVLSFFFTEETVLYNVIMYFIVVAVSEEGSKYVVLKRRTWEDPSFNCQFDGVVYAVTVSLGFALWENISYVFRYGLGTALMRAVTAVPGHACFGVFMGVWYGMSRKYTNWGNIRRASVTSTLTLLVPVLIHGTYDFICSMENSDSYYGSLCFLAFVAVMFFTAWTMVKKASRNDQYI